MADKISQLENHEWTGIFYIKGQKERKFSGQIKYTVNQGIDSGIEVLFLCPNFRLEEGDCDKIYGTIMSSCEKRKTTYIKFCNLTFLQENWSTNCTYRCRYEYMLLGDSLELLDSECNKINFTISELSRFFAWSPDNAFIAKDIFKGRYDKNKEINISWTFAYTWTNNELSSYLCSRRDAKNNYYISNSKSIDNNFKDFLSQNNIDEDDVCLSKSNIRPNINIELNEYEKDYSNILKEFFKILKLFEITSDHPIIPDCITLTNQIHVDDIENPILDSNGNIQYQTYKDENGNEKIAKNSNGEDAILYKQKIVNHKDENGNNYYHSIQLLYAFRRNLKAVQKDLTLYSRFGRLSFLEITKNNANLFDTWYKFYSQSWIIEILRFLFTIKSEGYYYPHLILNDILSAMNCIGDDISNSRHRKPETNIKIFFENLSTDTLLEKICEIFNIQFDTTIIQDYYCNSKGVKECNKIGINFKTSVIEIGNIFAQDIRHPKAHFSKSSNVEKINNAISNGLCDVLIVMIKSYIYRKIGVEVDIIENIINRSIRI